MIIQTAPIGQHRLAIMMYEHTALSHQFARSFGNKRFQGPEPNDLMFNVVLHHDAGWAEFDRNPVTEQATGLPYNLVETPAEYITVTSRLSPEFNQRQHPFCVRRLGHKGLQVLVSNTGDRGDAAPGIRYRSKM